MKTVLLVQTNYPGFLKEFDKKIENRGLTYKEMKRKWDQEWFGQGNFYSKALKKYGWKSDELIINDWVMQKQWAKEHGLNVNNEDNWLTTLLPESVKNYLGLRNWIKKILLKQIETIKPDVVYMHDLSILGVDEIRKMKKKVKLVAGQIACPLPLNRKPLYEYSLIVSSFPHYVKMFRKMGVKSEYMRWCFEKTAWEKFRKVKKDLDVVFIGGYSLAHSKGNQMLEKLAKAVKVDFWGYGVGSLPITSEIRKNYHGESWGKEMFKTMRRAKIVVNRHINVAGNIANNMRMFDVTGMGSLLVTDHKPNMEEFFKVGEEVVTYKSASDLVKKVKYYLNRDKEREKITKAGQKRTLKEHTYDLRMKELAKILEEHL